MEKFGNNYENVMFTGLFDSVSEPLKEYIVDDEGYLTQTTTSCTLLGVKSKSNGRWGWIDTNGTYILSPDYDTGWVGCYNGVIILERNGKYGGRYRNNQNLAFSFSFDYLGHCFRDVFLAHKDNRVQLMKPGEIKINNERYLGITNDHIGPIFGYLKEGFSGPKEGKVNVLTGVEL